MRVEDQDGQIALEPANPQVAYVPYYDPLSVYGPCGGELFQSLAGMAAINRSRHCVRVRLGCRRGDSAGFFYGAMDWHHHRVDVAHVNGYYYIGQGKRRGRPWQHDAQHRHGVPYRGASVSSDIGHTFTPPVTGSQK